MKSSYSLAALAALLAVAGNGRGEELAFKDQELPTRLTVGYAVRLVDMNADKRLDIAIVDSDRILWLENPNWTEHVILQGQTKRDNVCFAPHDLDGDGHLDLAIGADWRPADTKTGGTIQWITGGENRTSSWKLLPIGEYPVVHRMNFADLDLDGKQELLVLPLKGRGTTPPNFAETGTPLIVYPVPADPVKGPWEPKTICDDIHVAHNFQVIDIDGDKQPEILLVSFEGVSLLERQKDATWKRTLIGLGNQETSPNKGSSEIKLGRLAGGKDYIATIEPWHGHQVVVYTRPVVGTLRVPSSGHRRRSVVVNELSANFSIHLGAEQRVFVRRARVLIVVQGSRLLSATETAAPQTDRSCRRF